MHHIASFATSETLADASCGRNGKRWCGIIMKRTEPSETGPCSTKCNIFRHDIYDVGCTSYPFYGDRRYHKEGKSPPNLPEGRN
jgi:hypothetical protein